MHGVVGRSPKMGGGLSKVTRTQLGGLFLFHFCHFKKIMAFCLETRMRSELSKNTPVQVF